MIQNTLRDIVSQFNKKGKMAFIDGATHEQISRFERENKITLPAGYKEWLQFSDGGECFLPAGVQFYGVANKPMIDVSENDRPNDNYLVIGALSTGDPVLCEKNSERISIYNQEAGKIEDDETYHDFIAFLNDLSDLLRIEG